jgi:predicted nucleic acid-binding protein
MIVADASAMTELLLQTPLGIRVEARLVRNEEELSVPDLLDVEVAQAVRRFVRAGEMTEERAAATPWTSATSICIASRTSIC